MLCSGLLASAYDFTVDGIYYNKTSNNTAEVTYKSGYYYSGSIVIPKAVSYDGALYFVTAIGREAFSNCNNLKEVSISDFVKSIGVYAFKQCRSLKEIKIPASIKSIEEEAFSGCNGLIEVNILKIDAEIGKNAFLDCTSLKKVNISDLDSWCKINFYHSQSNPLYYAKHLYLNGKEVTKLAIPNTVTTIGKYAFIDCTELEEVVIPTSVTAIGMNAFTNCTSLKEVVIPKSVTTIGQYAFSGCQPKKAAYPSSVSKPFNNLTYSISYPVDDVVFREDGLIYGEKNSILYYVPLNLSGELIIPNKITQIGIHAFSFCANLSKVIIPNSIKIIEKFAFSECSGLKEIAFSSGITNIEEYAFVNCDNLQKVNISNIENWCRIGFYNKSSNPLYYANHLYLNEKEINNLDIPPTITSIKRYCFINCSSLTKVTIPNSVTSIDDNAFFGCSGLSEVVIPKSIVSIKSNAFSNCSIKKSAYPSSIINPFSNSACSISYPVNDVVFGADGLIYGEKESILYYVPLDLSGELTLPNVITQIGSNAFSNCDGLSKVYIPNTVKKINSLAFSKCTGLTEITIPSSITNIGEEAFVDCDNLKKVNISDIGNWCEIEFESQGSNPLTKANHLYLNGKEIIELEIPNTVKSINNYAFVSWTNLKKIVIPSSIDYIGSSAFAHCTGLKEVIIPPSVKAIGKNAFYQCYNIKKSAYPLSISSPFSNLTCSIYYPTEDVVLGESGLIYGRKNSILYYVPLDFTETQPIPKSVTKIGYRAFGYCSNLKKFIIPTSIIEIGEKAFDNCRELAEIVISNSVKAIGEDAFYATKLESLTFPKSVTSINGIDFDALEYLKSVTVLGPADIRGLDISRKSINFTIHKDCKISVPNGLISISRTSTQATATFQVTSFPENIKIIDDNDKEVQFSISTSSDCQSCSWENGILYIWDLIPDQLVYAYAFNNQISSTKTESITNTFTKIENYADKIAVTANWDAGDFEITDAYWSSAVISKGNRAEIPYATKAPTVDFYVFNDNKKYGKTFSYKASFPSVNISNERAQATSYTSARLSAEMNLSTGAIGGIEWRRNDAPDNVQSNQVEAPIVDGKLLGELRGLRDDVYYKFRPYFDRGDGVTYGDWVGFYTGDAGVYFDPEVGTLTATANATSATMSGYVVAGSDNVTGRGFEYRPMDTSSRSDEWTRIEAKGTYMTTTAEGLQPGIKYTYRAYAQTADKTYYGSEMSFITEDLSGIEDIAAESPKGKLSVQLRENPVNGQPVIRVSNSDGEMAQCRIISISGRLIYDAPIETTGDYETLDVYLERGIYILHMSTTTQMKTLKLIAR